MFDLQIETKLILNRLLTITSVDNGNVITGIIEAADQIKHLYEQEIKRRGLITINEVEIDEEFLLECCLNKVQDIAEMVKRIVRLNPLKLKQQGE